MSELLKWLTAHEALAVWLEGIALVAIFVWDRLDNRREHRETMKQIRIAQDQIKVSQNAERAWLLTEMDWPKDSQLKVVEGTSKERDKPQVEHTSVRVMLTCRNEGRSPAFVDKIAAHCEIVWRVREPSPDVASMEEAVAPLGAIGSGTSATTILLLSCSGKMAPDEVLSIFVAVEYHDVFEHRRITTCGYTVDSGILRPVPMRNRNT